MTRNKDGDPQKITGMTLIGRNKSSRLQAIRNKAAFSEPDASNANRRWPARAGDGKADVHDVLLLARQIIDRRLSDIISALPAGKQKRLFKIRFGVEIEQIRELPIKFVLAILQIDHLGMDNNYPDMKRVADLNYNGEPSAGKAD